MDGDLHTIEHEGFTIRTTAEPEDITPNFEFETKEEQEAFDRKLETGELSWFHVKVEAIKYGIPLASDFLGGCCYASLQEFIDSGDYYNDMVKTAIAEAKENIKGLVKEQRQAMQGAIDALSQNKTFPADIECAKNLLKTALAA